MRTIFDCRTDQIVIMMSQVMEVPMDIGTEKDGE